MATFVNDLRLTELATGEGSGSWGTTTNTNLELIAESFSFGTEAITTNADTHTTTIADGSTDPGRSLFLKYTGTLDSACTITIGPNTVSKLWFIENATSGSQSIIVSQGSGANITIPNGQTKAIYSDGAGSGAAMVDAFQDLSIPDLFIDDDLTIGDDLVFSSDSAVITFGADGDTTLTHTDGSGLTLNSTNKLMFNDASQFIQGSSATVLSLGATDEIDLTATLIDINGNADVSGTVTATGTSVFASLDISGDIDVDGTTNLDVVDIDGAVDMASTLQLSGGDVNLVCGSSGGDQTINFRNSSNTIIQQIHYDDSDGSLSFGGPSGGNFPLKFQVDDANVSDGERFRLTKTEAVFNEPSNDTDFRVESNGNTHMLFVDAGNDRVGIGMTPATDFHIKGVTTIDGDGSSRTEITSSTASSIVSLNVGGFDGTPSVARDLRFFTNAASNAKTEHMRISSSGNVLVGKTNTTFSDNGIELRASNGGARFIRSNAEPILMNRTGSGGAILGMYQDGTIKGEIGVESTGITFNESGADLDFRVESNGNSHALFVDAGNDRVGVLTSAPDSTLHVSYTSSNANPLLEANAGLNLEGSSSVRMLFGSDQSSPFAGYIQASNTGSGFPIALNPSGGNVGIGTTNPGELLSVEGSGNTAVSINTGNNSGDNSQLKFGDSADDDVGQINYDHGTNAMQFRTNAGSNSIVIDSAGATTFSGNVKASDILASGSGGLALQTDDGVKRITLEDSGTITLGNNSLAAATTLNARRTGATGDILRITGGNSNVSEFGAILIHGENVTGGTQKGIITFNTIDVASVGDATLQERVRVTAEGPTRFVSGSSTVPGITFLNDTNTGFNNASADNIGFVVGGSQKAFLSASQFNVTGNGVFSGSISKGSGSFKIDHPLPSKTDTHHLVHSFVEAPQADNIYRGSVDLVGGSATVNIDTAAGMTDGTFVLLNTNVQCFTSNESGWTAIKGSVSGNTLTITAQDSDCTDTISWMVVGERHDQHMKDTEWTDSDGKVIVEPEKVSEGE
jgi:hypothetical protein